MSFAQLCLILCDPKTVAHQALLSIAFSKQEYWRGLPFPTPGGLPNSGIDPASPVCLLSCRQILYLLSHWGSSDIQKRSLKQTTVWSIHVQTNKQTKGMLRKNNQAKKRPKDKR